ncbi:hypothetical protein N7488_012414 [Penicillium malachiteum]|nr:hypothetical protein N7488_012414 [Penicillium malachiteum]
MSVSREEADRVLRKRKSEREAHACYPCRKRKVKCDGSKPCGTCNKRKHPQICSYGIEPSPRRQSRQTSARSASPILPRPAPSNAAEQPAQQNDFSSNYVYSGDNSVISILRSRASDANEVGREVGSVLGLQNTLSSYPFMDSKTPGDKWKSLLGILPDRTEILRFFHHYRVTAYPFNPIITDLGQFEADLCTYLNAHAAGELQDPERISPRWSSDKSIGFISLLLAALAGGAHYSDVEYPKRLELTEDLARRSFHALRLANFLFRPSWMSIQALLILGALLRDLGQSDASWCLLGSTVRLGQTMGLHTERSAVNCPGDLREKAKTLWATIVWQDSLLCLCYDRPPIVSAAGWPLSTAVSERNDLSYAETMHLICRIGLDIMRPENLDSSEIDRAIENLQKLDDVCRRSQPYLQQNCITLQQNLEHLALRMHTSFCISVLCRPVMKRTQPQPIHTHFEFLRTRAKEGLIDASRAFLDFQALSIVPLRSWSMIHTVLSSCLLLCIWEETRNDLECRSLQQRVFDVFSSSMPGTREEGNARVSLGAKWLSPGHIRALVTLRSTLDREGEQAKVEPEGPPIPEIDFESLLPPGTNLDTFPDIFNAFDSSPVSYLDSIMNVPLFDFTQDNGFL